MLALSQQNPQSSSLGTIAVPSFVKSQCEHLVASKVCNPEHPPQRRALRGHANMTRTRVWVTITSPYLHLLPLLHRPGTPYHRRNDSLSFTSPPLTLYQCLCSPSYPPSPANPPHPLDLSPNASLPRSSAPSLATAAPLAPGATRNDSQASVKARGGGRITGQRRNYWSARAELLVGENARENARADQ